MSKKTAPTLLSFAMAAGLALLQTACGATTQGKASLSLAQHRDASRSRTTAELGGWLAAEMFSPGGSAKTALTVRLGLRDRDDKDIRAHLAVAYYDELHGNIKSAARAYLHALEAAQRDSDPNGELLAELAAANVVERIQSGHLEVPQTRLRKLVERPGKLGWGARMRLADAWARELRKESPELANHSVVQVIGCTTAARIAGPFGAGSPTDYRREFPELTAEPWPLTWPSRHAEQVPAGILPTQHRGCRIRAKETAPPGVFFTETFAELEEDGEWILVPDATAVWVNGHRVFKREPTEWGALLKESVKIRLPAGRHRVVSRSETAAAWLALLRPDGTPAPVKWSDDPVPGHSMAAPAVVSGAAVAEYLLPAAPAADGPVRDPLARVVAAQLAAMAGDHAVAAETMLPLTQDRNRSAGPALNIAMEFVGGDPLYGASSKEDRIRAFATDALNRDPDLWMPRLFLTLSEASRSGEADAIAPLRELTVRYPDLDAPRASLRQLYAKLGWPTEESETIRELARLAPRAVPALERAAGDYEARGNWTAADALIQQVLELDPDSHAEVKRAFLRKDFRSALRELRRLELRSDEPEEISAKIYEIEVSAGERLDTLEALRDRQDKDPEDVTLSLEVADAEFAFGDETALISAFDRSIREGAWEGRLRAAVDQVEGVTPVEAYRMDAMAAIGAYEARSAKLPGNATRVIDRAVYWMRSDGFGRVLNHQLIRIQSKEAIGQFSEWPTPRGIRLNLRVIKRDGRTFEPEQVSGKPTLTFPHLEIGDYIDAEWVEETSPSQVFRWYFTSVNVGSALSELIFITRPNEKLHVEASHQPPDMLKEEVDGLIHHRWTGRNLAPAPEEPYTGGADDHVPHIALWYNQSETQVRDWLMEQYLSVFPVDPRIRSIALDIVGDTPKSQRYARAQKLYRWVTDNVEASAEVDGRRAISGKTGSPSAALFELCRALGIPVAWGLARPHVLREPSGPMHALEQFSARLLVVETERGRVWSSVGEKWAPFGYVPDLLRGARAKLIFAPASRTPELIDTRVPASASPGAFTLSGNAELSEDGSATFDLQLQFEGAIGIALRRMVDEAPADGEQQLFERILGSLFPGAQLRSVHVENLRNPAEALRVTGQAISSGWARQTEAGLEIIAPTPGGAQRLTMLKERSTPLLVPETSHVATRLRVKLPKNATLSGSLATLSEKSAERAARVSDRLENGALILERHYRLQATRITTDGYPELVRFARRADAAMRQPILLTLDARPGS